MSFFFRSTIPSAFFLGVFMMLSAASYSVAQTSSLSINAEMRTAERGTVLDRISTQLEQGSIFYAEMTHHFTDGFTGEEVTTQGEVWVAENAYKIITEGQHISVQDDVSTVFNINENKVIISTYYPEEDDFAPSRLLGSYEERFSITGVEEPERGLKEVSLTSEDPFEVITSARLLIKESSLLPQAMFAEDQNDNAYETRFSEGAFMAGDEVSFSLRWPEDAEIIDLRD